MYYSIQRKRTSQGAPLKTLRNITCPYTGIQMISGRTFENIANVISNSTNEHEAVKFLSRYEKNMQKTEKTVFEQLSFYMDLNQNGTINGFINYMYENSRTNLILAQLKVLDEVDRLSQKLSAETQLEVRSNTTLCRLDIINKKPFKRKTYLTILENVHARTAYETSILNTMKNQALFLPNSSTNPDAFIVKYKDRSSNEILERFLLPSIATIEHIKPFSENGQNNLSNFLLVSMGANKMRENMSLDLFIEHFPDITKFVQLYIDEVVLCIKRGQLRGNENYPKFVSKTLESESAGRIAIILKA